MEQDIIDESLFPIQDKKRPTVLTVICILGFVGSVLALVLTFSEAAQLVGNWYPLYLGFFSATGLLCMIGLWKMKKWAIIIYTTMVIVNQIVLISMGLWGFTSIFIPGIVILIALRHYDKMD